MKTVVETKAVNATKKKQNQFLADEPELIRWIALEEAQVNL